MFWDVSIKHARPQHGADVARDSEAEGFQMGQRSQNGQERTQLRDVGLSFKPIQTPKTLFSPEKRCDLLRHSRIVDAEYVHFQVGQAGGGVRLGGKRGRELLRLLPVPDGVDRQGLKAGAALEEYAYQVHAVGVVDADVREM